MLSLWDALRMNLMLAYQEHVRPFPNQNKLIYNKGFLVSISNYNVNFYL